MRAECPTPLVRMWYMRCSVMNNNIKAFFYIFQLYKSNWLVDIRYQIYAKGMSFLSILNFSGATNLARTSLMKGYTIFGCCAVFPVLLQAPPLGTSTLITQYYLQYMTTRMETVPSELFFFRNSPPIFVTNPWNLELPEL